MLFLFRSPAALKQLNTLCDHSVACDLRHCVYRPIKPLDSNHFKISARSADAVSDLNKQIDQNTTKMKKLDLRERKGAAGRAESLVINKWAISNVIIMLKDKLITHVSCVHYQNKRQEKNDLKSRKPSQAAWGSDRTLCNVTTTQCVVLLAEHTHIHTHTRLCFCV